MVKFTIEAVLWHQPLKRSGLHPVYIKIYFPKEKTKYAATGVKVPKNEWDVKTGSVKDTYLDAAIYNRDIQAKLSELRHSIVGDQFKGKPVSAALAKARIKKGDQSDIFVFVDKLIEELAGKRAAATLENYKKQIKKLRLYHTGGLSFEQITPDYLAGYEKHLRANVENNYVYKLLGAIRTFMAEARKKKLTRNNPFHEGYEMPTYTSPDKEVLTAKELVAWESKIPEETKPEVKQAAVYFLFGCYTGLRISDIYAFSLNKNIDEEAARLRLRAKKNKTYVSIPITPPLARAIELVKQTPLTIAEQTLNEKLKDFAKRCKIHKHLTAHSARHTFAVTIILGNKISSETGAELMGITLQTFVDNYSQVTDEKIDRETAEGWRNLK